MALQFFITYQKLGHKDRSTIRFNKVEDAQDLIFLIRNYTMVYFNTNVENLDVSELQIIN